MRFLAAEGVADPPPKFPRSIALLVPGAGNGERWRGDGGGGNSESRAQRSGCLGRELDHDDVHLSGGQGLGSGTADDVEAGCVGS
ncbi:MAG: hypothetical protein CMO80_09790 [Verrucomicrobiales bacterium]|nr:hypothetical protein [Verrucomicrobiales bacterium]